MYNFYFLEKNKYAIKRFKCLGGLTMTKKVNKGSRNQNSPKNGEHQMELAEEHVAGDNSKGNKRNKDQRDKTRDES